MTDNLIKRLRKDNNPSQYGDLIDEAADRIEQLTKQRDELMEELNEMIICFERFEDTHTYSTMEKAKAAIANVKGQP